MVSAKGLRSSADDRVLWAEDTSSRVDRDRLVRPWLGGRSACRFHECPCPFIEWDGRSLEGDGLSLEEDIDRVEEKRLVEKDPGLFGRAAVR